MSELAALSGGEFLMGSDSELAYPADGGLHTFTVYGHYVDRLVRNADGWRIAQRHFRTTRTTGRLVPFDACERYESPPWL